ncbi:Ribosomal protein L1 [Artemisia annua]|uniref:Ribosomal protein L1 n=1 Tax=Artemisia annua TaxID=35608 RepID=A0A2U1QB87_ARTAN|nr:Ribosomal protein L1 [Artemisia annua]
MAISPSTTTAAIDALLKWHKTTTTTQTNNLNPEDDNFIYLVLTLKNIPQKGGPHGIRTTPYKIPLPNSLYSSPQVCLIIDDRPNSNLTSKQAKEKIVNESIPVSKVIKLSKLRTDYKPFEAKRRLCDSYDVFFADKRVVPFLPKLLGKSFFKTRKLPLGVDLGHKNWKEQIERGFRFGLLSFGSGTCSVVRVARVGMEKGEIVENVCRGVEGVVGFVGGKGILGVRSLHLKFSGSVALPLYQSLPDIKLRIEGRDGESVEDVMEIDGAGNEPGSAEVVNVKPAKKSGKDKKRKENVVVVEEKDTKMSDKKAKKKVSGDSGKKEKKKGSPRTLSSSSWFAHAKQGYGNTHAYELSICLSITCQGPATCTSYYR